MAVAEVDFDLIISESAAELIDSSPNEEEMEGHAQKVRDKYLKGTGKFTVANANLEDSQEFVKEVMANVSDSQKLDLSSAEITELSEASFDVLKDINGGEFLDATALASAQAGMDAASEVYGESFKVYSLTSNILEDGKITTMEAVRLGASAVSIASTMLAGFAGGAAMGPIGAVAGIVLGGISFLGSQSAARKARWEARREASLKYVLGHESDVDSWLVEQRQAYADVRELVWEDRDIAVAEVADAWAAFEDGLGVRFGLRYFPGERPPRRAGHYRKVSDGGISWKLPCNVLSGCPYFTEPNPNRVKELQKTHGESEGYRLAVVETLNNLAKNKKYITSTTDPFDPREYEYVNARNYEGLSYYNRVIRAFDSLALTNFWKPRSNRAGTVGWKNFKDLAYEWSVYYAETQHGKICSDPNLKIVCDSMVKDRNRIPELSKPCFESFDCHYSSKSQAYGFENVVKYYTYFTKPHKDSEPDIWRRAAAFVQSMQESLGAMNSETGVFKARIMGDLIQTANATGGELATATRLKKLLSMAGDVDIRSMSAAERRDFKALDPDTLSKIDRSKQRDSLFNNAIFAAGVGAAGFGAYRKWGKR